MSFVVHNLQRLPLPTVNNWLQVRLPSLSAVTSTGLATMFSVAQLIQEIVQQRSQAKPEAKSETFPSDSYKVSGGPAALLIHSFLVKQSSKRSQMDIAHQLYEIARSKSTLSTKQRKTTSNLEFITLVPPTTAIQKPSLHLQLLCYSFVLPITGLQRGQYLFEFVLAANL